MMLILLLSLAAFTALIMTGSRSPHFFASMWFLAVHVGYAVINGVEENFDTYYYATMVLFSVSLMFWSTLSWSMKTLNRQKIDKGRCEPRDSLLSTDSKGGQINLVLGFCCMATLLYSGGFLFDRLEMISDLLNSTNKIGGRVDFAYDGGGIFRNVYLHEFMIALMYYAVVITGSKIYFGDKKNLILITFFVFLPIILYSFANLSRGRMVDAFFVIFAAYFLSLQRRNISLVKSHIPVLLLLFSLFFVGVTAIRTDESLLNDQGIFSFSAHQIFDYFSKSVAFSDKYFSFPCIDSPHGSYTFKFFFLVLKNLGMDVAPISPCYIVLWRGEIATFETPSFLLWMYDDFGLLGMFLALNVIFGLVSLFFVSFLAHPNSRKYFLVVIASFLFFFKSIITYPLYDLWFWLLGVFIAIHFLPKFVIKRGGCEGA